MDGRSTMQQGMLISPTGRSISHDGASYRHCDDTPWIVRTIGLHVEHNKVDRRQIMRACRQIDVDRRQKHVARAWLRLPAPASRCRPRMERSFEPAWLDNSARIKH